jgi:HAMP domain-containing protein
VTIRSKLLLLLLPTLVVFVGLVSYFFYLNWYREIISNSKSHLKSIVVLAADRLDPSELAWIKQHSTDSDIKNNDAYVNTLEKLTRLQEKLPISSLYIVSIEPVKKGDLVLKGRPPTKSNKIYDGSEPKHAYRQVYLTDIWRNQDLVGHESIKHCIGDCDFIQDQEYTVYFTKEPLITKIYENQSTHEPLITGFAPVLDQKGAVVALVAADIPLAFLESRLHNALVVILITAALAVFLVTCTVFFIGNKISQPVQQLKNAALSIAAGRYGETIQVEEPREIVELANTLNTMSECLQENITRLQEGAHHRERLHGEYECSLILQYHMLQKIVDEFSDPCVNLQVVKITPSPAAQGILLRPSSASNGDLRLLLAEAKEAGFAGMYDLVSQVSYLTQQHLFETAIYPTIEVTYDSKYNVLSYISNSLLPPTVWSLKQENFLGSKGTTYHVESGDLIFLINQGLMHYFPKEEELQAWMHKVLKHFASKSFDVFTTMLSHELTSFSSLQELSKDLYILCIKIK